MSTINNIFVDSSVLIEYFKGSNSELLDYLSSSPDYNLLINDIVITEVVYHMLAYNSTSSPVTLKRKGLLKAKIDVIDFEALFMHFIHIGVEISHVSTITNLMSEFNLLSNDALIFNCCIEHRIPYLATFDSDFDLPCNQYEITSISSISQLTK